MNTPRDEARVGDEFIDTILRALIPQPYPVQQHTHQPTFEAGLETRLFKVLVLQIPGVTNRRVHITDVQLIGPDDHAFGHGMAGRQNEVIGREVELFDSQRHERQIVPRIFARTRQLLNKGGVGSLTLQKTALSLGHKVHHGKDIGLRKAGDHLLEHPLGARIGGEPVGDNGNLHGRYYALRGLAMAAVMLLLIVAAT